jgi:hypothetical protein
MRSSDELQAEILRICSVRPPATVFEGLWRLAEEESHDSVLSGILGLPDSVQAWLARSIELFYNEPEDDGREEFFAAALVGCEIVETHHFPKTWLKEVRKVLFPDEK